MLTGMDREVTYTTRQPLSLQVIQCALRLVVVPLKRYHQELPPRQVRTCTKSETSLRGLSNFTKLAVTPARERPQGGPPQLSLPALLHPSQIHVSPQRTRALAFVKHSIPSPCKQQQQHSG